MVLCKCSQECVLKFTNVWNVLQIWILMLVIGLMNGNNPLPPWVARKWLMKMLYGKIMGMRKLLKKIVFREMVGKCNRREKNCMWEIRKVESYEMPSKRYDR